ncbi:MAG: hypothetical protein HQM08_11595 [Candidatus Riflebacteria bacterium]|nr:hypothetical protein [Candidatus Riflebacteria bacterium]
MEKKEKILIGILGLSYLEIIIAVLIMTGTMIPIASMLGYGYRHSSKDYRNLAAIQLLESTLSQVLTADYDRIPTGLLVAPINTGASDLPLGAVASGGYTFNLSINVAEIPVSFYYRPINVSNPTFLKNDSSTWIFDPPTRLNLDNSNPDHKYKVKRVIGEIAWIEPDGPSRKLQMETFLARLKDDL